MHLNPADIENVAKLNIGQKLERRRRSVQLLVMAPAERNEYNRLKLPPAPRRQSLGGQGRGTSLRLLMPGTDSSQSPSHCLLPPIVPIVTRCATSSVPFSDDDGDLRPLVRGRPSALDFTCPRLPSLFMSNAAAEHKNCSTNDEAVEQQQQQGETDGAERSVSAADSVITSSRSTSRESAVVHQSARRVVVPLHGISSSQPKAAKEAEEAMVDEDGTRTATTRGDICPNRVPSLALGEEGAAENSLRAFVKAQENLAAHRAQLDNKLDVVRCHRMAVGMIAELLDRLGQKCHSAERSADEKPENQNNKLTVAEVQKDFFPYIYAKAEQLFFHRMENSYSNGNRKSDKK